MGVSIDELNPCAKKAAEYAIKNGLVVTSARRDRHSQAHAMSTNIVKNWPAHREWVKETYHSSDVRTKIQDWVDEWFKAHPDEHLPVDACTTALKAILDAASDDQLVHVSWHLSGDAFDCEPGVGDIAVLQYIVDHKEEFGWSAAKLLTREGGLERWHLQLHGSASHDHESPEPKSD